MSSVETIGGYINMEIIFFVIFMVLLVFVPVMAFFVIRRVFSIFRFIPFAVKEMVIPQLIKISENANTQNGGFVGPDGHYQRYQPTLSQEELDILKNSFLGKQIEINPKRFTKKAKKGLSLAGIFFGITILGVVLYKVFWVIYDFIVLTYF